MSLNYLACHASGLHYKCDGRKPVSRYFQRGMGLPVTIFILVIMSMIAVAVNQLRETGTQSYTQTVLSSRAFYAAESGAQLRAMAVLSGSPCQCGNALADYAFTVPGLKSCHAETLCNSFIANSETYCTITSIGSCHGEDARRTVEARVK